MRAETLAELYEANTALGDFYRSRMVRIAELLADVRGDLLDAGCGTGQMLSYLHRKLPGRFRLTGLDRSSANITVARGALDATPEPRLVIGRIEKMPLDSASFDVVLAMGSLEYVAGIEDALGELARVTRPGGLAVVTMKNPYSPYRLWNRAISSLVHRPNGSPILHCLTTRSYRAGLADAGFAPEKIQRYGFGFPASRLDAHVPRVAMRLEHALDYIVPGPLRWIATDYLVVARRTGASENGTA